nr:MAG TPA: hypothetical protein [Caudoviricetes sp.]
METIDLTPYLPEPLRITLGDGREWVIPPPSAEAGIALAAITALQTTRAVTADLPEEEQLRALSELPSGVMETLREHSEDVLADLALTPGVHAAMREAGLSAPAIDIASAYSATYWVTGSRDAADAVVRAAAQSRLGSSAADMTEDGDAPKEGSSPLTTGLRTGSGSRTRTDGTPTTGPHRPVSGRSHRGNRKHGKRRRRHR